jgi:hypothetical protein
MYDHSHGEWRVGVLIGSWVLEFKVVEFMWNDEFPISAL